MNDPALVGTEPETERFTVPRRGRSWLAFAIRVVLGLLLLGALFYFYGFRRVAAILARERPEYFGAAVALYLAGQVVSAYRWMLLAQLNGLGGRWREYLAYYFIGMFTNLFIPGLVGGDAARSTYLGLRENRLAAAVASVLADRGIGLVALFWFASLVILFAGRTPLPAALLRITLTVGFLCLAGYVVSPWLAAPFEHLKGRAGRLVSPIIPYLRRPVALVPAIALSLLLQASLAICQYLLAIGMGAQVSLAAVMLIVPLANVVTSLPITLNGLGVREGAYLFLFATVHLQHQDAIALGLLWFLTTVLGGLTGVFPFIVEPIPHAVSQSSHMVES
jgi:uncharacterized membrane protein YbhN (UPF0104 family)